MIVCSLILMVLLLGNIECSEHNDKAYITSEKDSTEGELAAVVALSRLTRSFKLAPYCGGTVIDKNIVLTAAHCVTDNTGKVDITGLFIVYNLPNLNGIHIVKAGLVAVHPEYNWRHNTNDIALVLVEASFPYWIHPIKIPKDEDIAEISSLNCQLVGWGANYSKNHFYDPVYHFSSLENSLNNNSRYYCEDRCQLKNVAVNMTRTPSCLTLVRILNYFPIQTNGAQFCIYININSHGNSGDPLICSGHLYGTAFLRFNGNRSAIIGTTSVAYYNKWIKKAKFHLQREEVKINKPFMAELLDAM